jgi:hypothetical protein
MEEAKEYLQEQCQQKKYYLEDHPQELVGRRLDMMKTKKNIKSKRGITWVAATCVEYDPARCIHQLEFKDRTKTWVDLRGRIFELDDERTDDDFNHGTVR